MSDKIAAIATGHARTGIGILRLSGDGCIEAAEQVFRLNSGRPPTSLPDRKPAANSASSPAVSAAGEPWH